MFLKEQSHSCWAPLAVQQVATSGSSGSYNFEARLTERPTRRFLLSVLRPFLVCMRALKPLFRDLFILLLRRFSTKNSPVRKIKSFLLINYAVFLILFRNHWCSIITFICTLFKMFGPNINLMYHGRVLLIKLL
jgi:hypothetical protein